MNAAEFRRSVRALVRALGLFDEGRTPCGVEVSVREAYALEAIARAEAARTPLSQSDLQRSLGVDKSNVTRLVQQMVAAGRVEQRAADGDARVRLLHLTAKGRRVARNVEDQSLQRFAAVLERIPTGERTALLRALERFRVALEPDTQEIEHEQE